MLSEEQINEGNKLIGEFMGYTMFNKRYPINHGVGAPENVYKDMIIQKAKYHKSWDALMGVLDEIGRKEYYYTLEPYCFTISFAKGRNLYASIHFSDNDDFKITKVWLKVVRFINFYNKQQKDI